MRVQIREDGDAKEAWMLQRLWCISGAGAKYDVRFVFGSFEPAAKVAAPAPDQGTQGAGKFGRCA
jgi:hypothetical protein